MDWIHPANCLFRREIGINANTPRSIDTSLENTTTRHHEILGHYATIKCIEFSFDEKYLITGGVDRQVLVWNVDNLTGQAPYEMKTRHDQEVIDVCVDNNCRKIVSSGADHKIIVHDLNSAQSIDQIEHQQLVPGIHIGPADDNILASASESGKVLLNDLRESLASPSAAELQLSGGNFAGFHSIQFHPTEPRTVLTGNSFFGVHLWDLRNPVSPIRHYNSNHNNQFCIGARFSSDGKRILAIPRYSPPIVYTTSDVTTMIDLQLRGFGTKNRHTSGTFAGLDDQYVLAGSGNSSLHLWKIPAVNQSVAIEDRLLAVIPFVTEAFTHVRYNKRRMLIASTDSFLTIRIASPFEGNIIHKPNVNTLHQLTVRLHERFRRDLEIFGSSLYRI